MHQYQVTLHNKRGGLEFTTRVWAVDETDAARTAVRENPGYSAVKVVRA
jgi:hypothetical protein